MPRRSAAKHYLHVRDAHFKLVTGRATSVERGAVFDKLRDDSDPDAALLATGDVDLARVIRAWPTLPEAVRSGIVAMVAAASLDSGR